MVVTTASLVLVALTDPMPHASATAARPEASTCAQLVDSTDLAALAEPARKAADAYRTACALKRAGLGADGVRALAQKAAVFDPSFSPPTNLLASDHPPLVSASNTLMDMALALAKIAGVLVGLLLVLFFAVRASLGRSRRLRNLVGRRPSVSVEPAAPDSPEELKNLPSLLQSVFGNLGADLGGQNIQFVSPSSDDVSENTVPASAPAQLEYITWIVALLRPLAPKDKVTVRLTPQPEGRQGLGVTAALVSQLNGRTINATTLWEADVGLQGIGADGPELSERERYQLLVAPIAAWLYFTLADLTQQDCPLLGTRNWRSYGQFSLGCRLYKTHRQRGQRLLREAIDADSDNLAAHLNILLLEFDGRRTVAGKEQLELVLTEVKALPSNDMRPKNRTKTGPGYWYDPTWYRTMYSLAAVCFHLVSEAANDPPDPLPAATVEQARVRGRNLSMELVGACWIALNALLPGGDGRPDSPKRWRGKKGRLRYRQRQELALLLGQMLSSSVLLLANVRMYDPSDARIDPLEPGSKCRVTGPNADRRIEWRHRAEVLCRLDPRPGDGRTCPEIHELLSAVDPLEFLPSRARYNVACLHSEMAQHNKRFGGAEDSASKSRAMALAELEKGLDHDSAQWAREDPALWEVRTDHTSRTRFADLVARELCAPEQWEILSELPFIGVPGAARLWVGAGVKDERSLRDLGAPDVEERRGELLANPGGGRWLGAHELSTWIARADLRAHLVLRFPRSELVNGIEELLHHLGIGTAVELAAHPPGQLSRNLVSVAPAELRAHGALAPVAVEVWAR